MGKLTTLAVKAAKPDPDKPRRLSDGDGLALVIKPNGARSWVLRVQVAGRRRDFGLGSGNHVTLAEARDKAREVRKEYSSGLDPVAEKRRRNAPPAPTFAVAAERMHKELALVGKHRDDYLSSLKRHAFPKLGKIPVDQIDGPMIRDTLLPIWLEVPETARRVRQRIGAILDWSHSNGFRPTEAPLRSVTKGLPRQSKERGHFAAMPYPDVPAFVASLYAADETMGRVALLFTIFTAARSGETRGAQWSEFDLNAAKWTIPATRMKAKQAHEVPLSAAAVAIVRKLKEHATSDVYVFPGKGGNPLSDMTLSKIMRDAKVPYVVHGFRSSFRDWVGEQTNYPGDVAEAALAHTVKNSVERAYHRTKYFEKRRPMMDAWADFCLAVPAGNVVSIMAKAG